MTDVADTSGTFFACVIDTGDKEAGGNLILPFPSNKGQINRNSKEP